MPKITLFLVFSVFLFGNLFLQNIVDFNISHLSFIGHNNSYGIRQNFNISAAQILRIVDQIYIIFQRHSYMSLMWPGVNKMCTEKPINKDE